jgi:hypothetical protein
MAKTEDSLARMWKADGIIVLLGKLDVERMPLHEGQAVGSCQAQAVDEWLSAYAEMRRRERRVSPTAQGTTYAQG